MLRIAAIAGLLTLCAAQDLTAFYDGWHHAVGLKSSFGDKMSDVLTKAKEEMEQLDLHKPVMSLLETGEKKMESMSEGTAMQIMNFLKPLQEKIEAIQFEAQAARGSMGFSMGGLGLPRPDTPQAKAIWDALIASTTKQEKKPASLLESSSATQSVSSAVLNQRMQQSAKMMRSTEGKQMLQFAEQFAMKLEQEAKESEKKMHAMMDKLMGMTLEERQPLMKEYEELKFNAKIAEEAHKDFDMSTDNIYKQMAKFPDEQMMNPADVALDNTVDKEFEELLHDPKMQSMMQMSEELTPSSFLQSSVESTQMASMAVTAEGRVGMTGVDEEGTEEQGAAQAAELLKMFDVHVGHFGSAPSTLTSFIQTHDQLTDQQRQEAQSKAILQRRVSKAMSRSAQIDKLLDDAIMDYLSDPKLVEEKPTVIEEIAGAFRSNSDPLYAFAEHPLIVRYRNDQKQNAVLPPRPVQKQLMNTLLKDAPEGMKMAVIHADLDAPGTRELKIRQDLICMKKTLLKMKKTNIDAQGKEGEIKIFVDVQGGGAKRQRERMVKEIQRALEDIEKVSPLHKLGDQKAQDYAVGLADFVYRIGEGPIADSHNIDLAAFKTEALKRGGVIKADVTKTPSEMCTLDNQNLEEATTKAFEKFTRINKILTKVDHDKKEKKMLSETEQWAQQQRRVEHNRKRHGAATVDVDFKPKEFFRGFGNLLRNSKSKAERADAYGDAAAPSKRRAPNYGLYAPNAQRA